MSHLTIFQRLVLFVLVAAIAVATSPPAAAESDGYSDGGGGSSHYQAAGYYSAPYGFSSTAYEGALRGRAALVEAWGNFSVRQSQAAILWQQARALDRENDVEQTVALFEQREIWRQARELERKAREARDAAGKAKLAARIATEYRDAYALSADELDCSTGQIHWPAALLAVKYECGRRRVDELFRKLASYPAPQPALSAAIAREVDALVRALRTETNDLPRHEYLAAQKFLRGLKYAAVDVIAASQG